MNWLDIFVAVVIWQILDALFPETFLDRWGRALAAKVGHRLGNRPEHIDGYSERAAAYFDGLRDAKETGE